MQWRQRQAGTDAREDPVLPEAEPAPAPFLPAWRDPTGQGLDSLGRGLDAGRIAAVVAGDRQVQREREVHVHYLQGTYRDPWAARAALHEVVKQDGWAKAAQEVARDPTQFSELRGKVGWFVSAKVKEERATAERKRCSAAVLACRCQLSAVWSASNTRA